MLFGIFKCVYCILRESTEIIPKFIIEHFDRTGDKKLPLPRVKSTRKIGSTVHHRLVYEDDPTLDQWVPLANYTDLGDTVSLSCKTEKDKDKRSHRWYKIFLRLILIFKFRHSCGIFVGSWPCGVITCFDELWGSEGKAQVCF